MDEGICRLRQEIFSNYESIVNELKMLWMKEEVEDKGPKVEKNGDKISVQLQGPLRLDLTEKEALQLINNLSEALLK